ncbi:MAG TPA: calcium-binding protein [Rubrobacter sp.]
MKKTVLLFASMIAALMPASGLALAATIDCSAGLDSCVGTDGPDSIKGSEERDRIFGLGGDDTLLGNGGNDRLTGGSADDTIKGNGGEDRLIGGPDNDTMNGGTGGDILASSPGNDKLYGSSNPGGTKDYVYDWEGRNVLSGGAGDDHLYGHNRISGGSGDDVMRGSRPNGAERIRTMSGGPGTDQISSEGFVKDTIYAQDGEKDFINCGGGIDVVYFDTGIDSASVKTCENRIGN